MLLDSSFISEHEGVPGFVGVINHSTANRINCTTPLLAAAFLFLQLLARLEARRCLKDIEARLFTGDGGPEHGKQLSASPLLHYTL